MSADVIAEHLGVTKDSIELGGPMRRLTSALYVDFDNVYIGLAQLDEATAEAFANDPGRLLRHLNQGRDEDGDFERRFLVRDCYLNPHRFARYRAQFVAAGFRVIDCPSLTQRGKSAADTHIVIDVVDALSHVTRYDEFVICSADADFSPLMTKLRRHNRRTLMIAAGNAAPAYQAVCDATMGGMDLVTAFSDDDEAPDDLVDTIDRLSVTKDESDRAVAAVRERVAASDGSVPGSSAAAAALREVPHIAASGWAGTGGFGPFVRQLLPELEHRSTDSGGLVHDPSRQASTPSQDADTLDDVRSRVARVTKAPLLTSQQYAVLFDGLAQVAKVQPRLGRIGFDVRELTADSIAPVRRTSVNFVVTGLVYAGADPRTVGLDARGLAERWYECVLYRCEQAGLELTDEERGEVQDWILSDLPPAERQE